MKTKRRRKYNADLKKGKGLDNKYLEGIIQKTVDNSIERISEVAEKMKKKGFLKTKYKIDAKNIEDITELIRRLMEEIISKSFSSSIISDLDKTFKLHATKKEELAEEKKKLRIRNSEFVREKAILEETLEGFRSQNLACDTREEANNVKMERKISAMEVTISAMEVTISAMEEKISQKNNKIYEMKQFIEKNIGGYPHKLQQPKKKTIRERIFGNSTCKALPVNKSQTSHEVPPSSNVQKSNIFYI